MARLCETGEDPWGVKKGKVILTPMRIARYSHSLCVHHCALYNTAVVGGLFQSINQSIYSISGRRKCVELLYCPHI
jgi:hypothetical protein